VSDTKVDRWLLEVVGATRPPAEMPRAGVLVLGSDSRRAGYVVPGRDVEGAHCAIGRMKGGGFAIKDLGSRGGTFLNGRRVESARLAAGDEIGIGAATLRVVDPENPTQKPSRAPRPEETVELEGERAARAAAQAAAAPAAAGSVAPSPVAAPPVAAAPVAAAPVSQAPAKTTNGSDSGSSRTVPLPSIPGYRIERRLGRGGMGDVYLAVQESLARQVALKVLAARFEADREFVRRFQAEARAAAALNHPNVVTVFDVGEAAGTHYLSMEYMDRGNLEDRLKNGARMSEAEVLDILRDATTGLVYAEARGIVHRDLKPANLMQNHVGATKIADLGLATHVESEEEKVGDKKVFGTPHFMSPEQARGERVDSRSDLFSLGATAYRLLTGKTPFEGKEAREIVRALLRDEPKPMRDSVPELSDGIVALVDRLMKKDTAQRFASASEVLKEIERLRAPAPHAVSIAGEPRPVPAKRGGRMVLVLLLVAAGGWWYWQAKQDQAKNPTRVVSNEPREGPIETTEPADRAPVAPEKPDHPTGTPNKEKDDKDLQLLEANAKLALLELKSKQMSPTERRDELRILASRYQGTSAATEALQSADEITNEMQSAEVARAARKIEVDAIMERLRAAARVDDVPPHPGKSFIDMRTVEGQAALRDDPQFVEARKSLETVVSRTAVLYAQQLLSDATQLMDKGDYEGGMKKFAELMPVFDLPDFPMGEAPAGVSELFDIGRTARERMHTFEASRDVFERRREHDDAVAIAQGFGGPAGLERELRSLDFESARARLEGIVPKVAGAPSQAFLKEQAADCERARVVIDTLARECAAGNWRRKGFTDPRDRKGATRNAVGADATGLLYEGPGGVADHVPWSAFGGNTKEISKLFSERCTREWTPEEMHGITALLRMTACIEAIDVTAKMFDGAKKANFTDANQKELADAFAIVTGWTANAPAEREETAREAAAAAALGTTMRLTTDGKWSAAVAETERLITAFKDSLLVRLLSNGLDPDAVK
jgi:hypothetical protein